MKPIIAVPIDRILACFPLHFAGASLKHRVLERPQHIEQPGFPLHFAGASLKQAKQKNPLPERVVFPCISRGPH